MIDAKAMTVVGDFPPPARPGAPQRARRERARLPRRQPQAAGLSDLPYLKFLPWSALGAVTWATYTCLLAYWVGSTIEDYPLAWVIISGAITTALISILFLRERRRRQELGIDAENAG